MSMIWDALRKPGAMRETIGAAPTQKPRMHKKEVIGDDDESIANSTAYVVKVKARLLDRLLDRIVRLSGSAPAFVVIQALLVAWAFLGIPFHDTTIWPVIVSDAQAIFSYVFDSFLMRQQLNGYYEGLDVAAELKSRNDSKARMISLVVKKVGNNKDRVAEIISGRVTEVIQLPKENWFEKFITFSSSLLGHILFIAFYWACIFVWLGFGPANEWSSELYPEEIHRQKLIVTDQWQLDINSSTSALMVFVFSFLAILRERHAGHLRSRLDAIYRLDAALEMKLRRLTGDEIPNQEMIIAPACVNGLQRAINYYADVVGTLVGIALLIAILVIWLALGSVFSFDANWWLFIGTYAGLIGLNDGFVLRNIQAKLREHEQPHYDALHDQDVKIFQEAGLEAPAMERPSTKAISYRVSEKINGVCGHEITVMMGVFLIIGLLVDSSVMMWSETGQLLCNVPPSIIESFFMIILITGHNASDKQRRSDMTNLFERRRQLLAYVDAATQFLQGNVQKKG